MIWVSSLYPFWNEFFSFPLFIQIFPAASAKLARFLLLISIHRPLQRLFVHTHLSTKIENTAPSLFFIS